MERFGWSSTGNQSVCHRRNLPTVGSPVVPYYDMVGYRLVLDGLAAFVVDITSTSGSRSMRRFPTEAAALRWMAEQEFRDAATESVTSADSNQSSTLPS